MEKLKDLLNLAREAGYKADFSYDDTKVNVYNKQDELIGQLMFHPNLKTWFSVFDTDQMQITPEGGQFTLTVDGIKSIIEEFRYR
jgi:hypothetical protein